jgi:outer membrane protein
VLLYFIGIVVTVLLVFTVKKEFSSPEIAFVDIGKLTDGYKFKKDLEKGSSQNLYRIKYVLDSLEMVKKATGPNPELDGKIAKVQDAFQRYYVQTNQEITQKIWDRLNPLMEQYGKEKGMQLLIGANGAGTVLYGSATTDVTEDVLRYINTKYEKGS